MQRIKHKRSVSSSFANGNQMKKKVPLFALLDPTFMRKWWFVGSSSLICLFTYFSWRSRDNLFFEPFIDMKPTVVDVKF